MSRRLIVALLAVLLLLPGVSGTVARAEGEATITLAGKLEYITTEAPHYEVNGYVLITQELASLQALTGRDVVVVGTEYTGPSVYMRKGLLVQSITAPATPPAVEPVPTPPAIKPPIAILPVAPPAPAIPYIGTPFYVFFGQVKAVDGRYYIVQTKATGTAETLLSSKSVDLERLVGEQVGIIASRVPTAGGQVQYHVIAAIVLSGDLTAQLADGTAVIYAAPPAHISVRLRGKLVEMDQAPVVGNGRTLVGLRAISAALGADVSWDQATRTATVTLGDRQVLVTLGSNLVVVREAGKPDQVIEADVTPIAAGGRVLVPVRVLAESLGLSVGWQAESRTVVLE